MENDGAVAPPPRRKKTGGRKKGTPNKRTVAFAEALKLAYQRIGGDSAFVKWCRGNPDIFYTGLMAKFLPHELGVRAELQVIHDPPSDIEVAARIAFVLARAQQPLLEAEPAGVQKAPPVSQPPPGDILEYQGSAAEQGWTRRNPRSR